MLRHLQRSARPHLIRPAALQPWIRTLLELQPLSTRSSSSRTSTGSGNSSNKLNFDTSPFLRNNSHDPEEQDDQHASLTAAPTNTNLDISLMPPGLRSPIEKTLPFFVQMTILVSHWYEPITFAQPAFLRNSRAAIDQLAASRRLNLRLLPPQQDIAGPSDRKSVV